MGQVSKYLTAPYQGVSQAPPQVRLAEQAEALMDVSLNLPEGATKRPPITWLGKLELHPGSTDGTFSLVQRPDGDRILTCTLESGVVIPRVYKIADLTREDITVSSDAAAYLASGATHPDSDLRILTVQDFTFLSSRAKLVQNTSSRNSTRPFEAMLWVKSGGYGRQTTITVTPSGGSPLVVFYNTPDGSNSEDAVWVDTDHIATILTSLSFPTNLNVMTTIAARGGVPNGGGISTAKLNDLTGLGFTVEVDGPVIYLSAADDFTIEVTDGAGGEGIGPIKDKVDAFSDLPIKAKDGFTVRLTNETVEERDDFFVKFDSTVGVTGSWEECLAPDAALGLDPNTMPVGLVDTDTGWQVNVLAWTNRTVGDEVLNPDPDFIGATIQDITFFRGRLAVVSNEGVTLSSANNPFQFYPTTLTQVLDGDPVGLLSPFPGVSLLRYALPYGKRLVCFGDRSQVEVHSNQDVLTPKSAQIDELASYEFANDIRPFEADGNVYFAAPKGSTASAIYELQVTSDIEVTNLTSAEDLTTAVPTYIPGTIDRVAYCPVNYVALYGQSGEDTLVYHTFRYANGQKVQNAFTQWSVPVGFTMGGLFFSNTKLYLLLIDADSAAHVGVMDIAPNVLDPGSTVMNTRLDMRITEAQATLVYESTTDQTLVTMPYRVDLDDIKATVRAPGGSGGVKMMGTLLPAPEGTLAQILTAPAGDAPGVDQFVLKGDWTSVNMWFGITYTMRMDLSRFYLMDSDGRPNRSGRLQLRKLEIDYADTGYFRTEVTATGRPVRVTEFTGYKWDDPQSIWNAPPNSLGSQSVRLASQNEQTKIALINDSHFPCKLLGWQWTGEFNPKASRS